MTHEKLYSVMTKSNGSYNWARAHNCEFGLDKFQLLYFFKRTIPHPFRPKTRIPVPRSALKLVNM